MINSKLKATGMVDVVVTGSDGSIKEQFKVENLVVDAGLAYIASRMKDATATAMTHMGLGTSTTAAAGGQTDLVSQTASRVALSSTTVTSNAVQYITIFTAGVCTGAITEAGIFNASTSGTMLARTVFSVVNKGASDAMTITWTITIA